MLVDATLKLLCDFRGSNCATIVAGQSLRRGTHRTYCMAAVNSPLGTLGIVILVTLMRARVVDWLARSGDGGGDRPGSSPGLEVKAGS